MLSADGKERTSRSKVAARSLKGLRTLITPITPTYTIISGLPAASYHSTISVSPDPKSPPKWMGTYDAKGATDARQENLRRHLRGRRKIVGRRLNGRAHLTQQEDPPAPR